MPTPIILKIGDLELKGEFNDTPAGKAAADALPFDWSGSRWGDEYYGPPSVDFGDHPGDKGTVTEHQFGEGGHAGPFDADEIDMPAADLRRYMCLRIHSYDDTDTVRLVQWLTVFP